MRPAYTRPCLTASRSAPLRYILLTQGHVDHVGGVAHFQEPGTQVIAQENNRSCQRDDERIAGAFA